MDARKLVDMDMSFISSTASFVVRHTICRIYSHFDFLRLRCSLSMVSAFHETRRSVCVVAEELSVMRNVGGGSYVGCKCVCDTPLIIYTDFIFKQVFYFRLASLVRQVIDVFA